MRRKIGPNRPGIRGMSDKETIEPKLATLTLSTTVLATELGVAGRYVQKIRGGVVPHARHFKKLAELAGVKNDDKAE
jgi:hypothetical protein